MSQPHDQGSPSPCPDDGILLGYLDDALSPEEREGVATHVDACRRCAETLQTLGVRARGISDWLTRHEPEPPTRAAYDLAPRRSRGTLRRHWMAAAAIVVTAGVAVGPARGWLLQQFGLVTARNERVAPSRAGQPATTAFLPVGPEVTLDFDAGVDGRRLSVERWADSLVTLRAPGPDIELVIRPNGVEIHDARQRPRDYFLTVPVAIQWVLIRVPGAPDVRVTPGVAGDAHVVEVQPGSG